MICTNFIPDQKIETGGYCGNAAPCPHLGTFEIECPNKGLAAEYEWDIINSLKDNALFDRVKKEISTVYKTV